MEKIIDEIIKTSACKEEAIVRTEERFGDYGICYLMEIGYMPLNEE